MKHLLIYSGVFFGLYVAGIFYLNIGEIQSNSLLFIFIFVASLHVYLIAIVAEFISGFVFKINQPYLYVIAFVLGSSYVPAYLLGLGIYYSADTVFFLVMVPASIIVNPYAVRVLFKFVQKAHNKSL